MRSVVRIVALLFVGLASPVVLAAQRGDSPFRSELHRADLSGAPGMEVITSIVRIKPGQWSPPHSHPGTETAYVVHGTMVQYPNRPPQMLETGTPLFHLRNAVHSGFKVIGPGTLVIYAVHVVDKGKPLYQPATKPGGN